MNVCTLKCLYSCKIISEKIFFSFEDHPCDMYKFIKGHEKNSNFVLLDRLIDLVNLFLFGKVHLQAGCI